MDYVVECITSVDAANQHIENARAAYKKHLYRRCTAQATKASDRIYNIISHPERIDDEIYNVMKIAEAFSHLNIPFPTSDGITTMSGIICYPNTETFACLYFYIQNVGKLFVEKAQLIQRISGKRYLI